MQATRWQDTLRSTTRQAEGELARAIAYINDKVVPEVRRGASSGLRLAASQCERMAEQLEGLGNHASAAGRGTAVTGGPVSSGRTTARSCAALVCVVLAGCGHRRQLASTPPPPAVQPAPAPVVAAAPLVRPEAPAVAAPVAAVIASGDPADLALIAGHQPIYVETGTASWYGPPYNRRRGANGEIFDQNMLSAAHRTLPMNSLLRVTNLKTGQASVMRVTDRGPFVPGRVLDLSVASAKSIGVWLPGTANVRIEVFNAPKPIAEGGRWCVQVGAFQHEAKAIQLEQQLQRRYQSANVVEFTGPTGHWVRIRPAGDDKARAVALESELRPEEGAAYLVRLD